MRGSLVFCLCWLVCLSPSVGLSQQKRTKKPSTPQSQPAPREPAAPEGDFAKAKALFDRGESFYKLGEYEKALSEYREAYLVSKAPMLLINIAQCYRYVGKYEEAKHNYEAYLREDPSGPYQQDIKDKITEMETVLEAKRRETSTQGPSSLVVMVQSPTEAARRKTWMWGGAIGAVVLGSAVLTFTLLQDDTLPPTNGGDFGIKF